MSKRRARTRNWAQEQERDPWVRRARAAGLPARSAFKLQEIVARHRLLAPGMRVLELGAAPGGWTRIAAAAVGPGGRVVAVDRLAMTVPPGVVFLRGDLTEAATRAEALRALGAGADVVLCDLAPNITGIREVDEAREAALNEVAADIAAEALRPGGALLIKLFEGEAAGRLRERLAQEYAVLRHLKPAASRARSREFYLLAERAGQRRR